MNETRTRRWGQVGAALLLVAVLGAGTMLVREYLGARETAHRVICAENLRTIGNAILLYGNDHRGQTPPAFDLLIGTGPARSEVFICPSSHEHPATGATTQRVTASFAANPRHCSYVCYTGPIQISRFALTGYEGVVRAYEPLGHHGDGLNAVFGDGHVEWVGRDAAKWMLSELAAGRNPPR